MTISGQQPRGAGTAISNKGKIVDETEDRLSRAVGLHLGERVSLRDIERATGIPRSTLGRHVVREKAARKKDDQRSRRRFRRLQQQGHHPEWIGRYQNGGIEWGTGPQELTAGESFHLTKERRETLAECLGVSPRHRILSRCSHTYDNRRWCC